MKTAATCNGMHVVLPSVDHGVCKPQECLIVMEEGRSFCSPGTVRSLTQRAGTRTLFGFFRGMVWGEWLYVKVNW